MTNDQQRSAPTTNDQQPTTNIYIGLGSNTGQREDYLWQAIREMENEEIMVINQSSLYESEAWGYEDQPAFLNQVVEVSTLLSPEHLLHRLKSIEKKLGRQKRERWHEREIDLDILYFDQRIIHTPELQIPHRYVRERNFVLVPLAEIAATYQDPETKESIQEILLKSEDTNTVILYKQQ